MRSLALLSVLLLLPLASAQVPHPHDQVFHSPATVEDELRRIAEQSPELVTVGTYGASTGGLPLWRVDVVHPDAVDPFVYYLDANHHGNEQMGMEALLLFLDELAAWSATPEGADRLRDIHVVAAPMINPDGTGADKRTNTRNVDLNRNYDYHWGLYGTADNPASLNYRGASAESEPETQANADLMRNLRPDLYLSMHTGSHDIVLPWRQAEDADGPMPDWPVYEVLLADIEGVSGLAYRDPSGAGESISYGYGALGALSLIVEVDTTQFLPASPDEVAPRLAEEVAIYWLGLERLEDYGGHLEVQGDRIVNVGLGPAYQVRHDADAGQRRDEGRSGLTGTADLTGAPLLAKRLDPGASVPVPVGGGAAVYERVLQGDDAKPVWYLPLHRATPAGVDDEGAPAVPLALVGAALVAVALVRRKRV